MKYFLAENANRKLLGEVAFEPIDLFAGTVRGVYATKYDTLAAKLASVRRRGRPRERREPASGRKRRP